MDEPDWDVVCEWDFAPSLLCVNGLCAEPYHLTITTKAEHKKRFSCQRKAISRTTCDGHDYRYNLRPCIVIGPNLTAWRVRFSTIRRGKSSRRLSEVSLSRQNGGALHTQGSPIFA
jgi:hypothetical protein